MNRRCSRRYKVVEVAPCARSAGVMAYNDGFLFMAVALVIGGIAAWFCKKPDPASAGQVVG